MRIRTLLVPMVLMAASAGCGGDDGGDDRSTAGGDEVATDAAPASPAASESCESDASLETTENLAMLITVDGVERSYVLYAPSGVGVVEAAPLVLIHHGLSGTAEDMARVSRFDETAEQEGLIVAYPDAGDGEWNLADDADTDFVRAVIDDVAAVRCVDQSRVYAVGFSQGGHMAGLLSCAASDRIAALGTVASWMAPEFGTVCPDAAPMPALFIVGTYDPFAKPDSGYSCVGAPDCSVGPIAEEVGAWAANNNCEPDHEEGTTDSGLVSWQYSCPAESDVAVQFHGGGHVWPHGPLDTNSTLWSFLSSHAT